MARRRRQLVQHSGGLRLSRYARLRIICFTLFPCCHRRLGPRPTIIYVHDATGAPNRNPSVPSELLKPGFPTKAQYRCAHGSLVDPSGDNSPLPPVPLAHFAVFANDAHSFSVGPPCKVGNAAAAVDPNLCDPLQCHRVENGDYAAALFGGALDAHPPSTRGQLEPFHGFLLFSPVCGTIYLFDPSRVEIPYVKVPAAAREENAIARRSTKCRSLDRSSASVK